MNREFRAPCRGLPRRFSPIADFIRFLAGNCFAKIAPTPSNPSVYPRPMRAHGGGRRFRGLVVAVMLHPLACAYPLLRPTMRDDRNSCGCGATRGMALFRALPQEPAGPGPVKTEFNFRTIPIFVKSKMAILLLTLSEHKATRRNNKRQYDRGQRCQICERQPFVPTENSHRQAGIEPAEEISARGEYAT